VAKGRAFLDQPTYILNDGLLVPESQGPDVAWQLQVSFEVYCRDQGRPLMIQPAVIIERNKELVANKLPMKITDNPQYQEAA
jgi:hypothetical protein